MRRNKSDALRFGIPFAVAMAASATSWASPALVSGPSPFAGCKIGGPGTVYVNAEVEPWMVVNPQSPANLIAR